MYESCYNLSNIINYDTSDATSISSMFRNTALNITPDFNTINVQDMEGVFYNCANLTGVLQYITTNTNTMSYMFANCNKLSNASIQNIINMCLNSNITNTEYMNLSVNNFYSPLRNTIFDNSYYQNRWAELDAAGWSY